MHVKHAHHELPRKSNLILLMVVSAPEVVGTSSPAEVQSNRQNASPKVKTWFVKGGSLVLGSSNGRYEFMSLTKLNRSSLPHLLQRQAPTQPPPGLSLREP
ncbi:phospholipid phosphatase 6-like protein [Lates japonicus]|uniref:Phospholipid phosphatase 6-like protein n=1 Tax=Lates japonicus TaxID=270547 RepID=A0AAD3R2U7_LATJO|nr:phospholipid phosphatase 6-like protein [Lates japonicus]